MLPLHHSPRIPEQVQWLIAEFGSVRQSLATGGGKSRQNVRPSTRLVPALASARGGLPSIARRRRVDAASAVSAGNQGALAIVNARGAVFPPKPDAAQVSQVVLVVPDRAVRLGQIARADIDAIVQSIKGGVLHSLLDRRAWANKSEQ